MRFRQHHGNPDYSGARSASRVAPTAASAIVFCAWALAVGLTARSHAQGDAVEMTQSTLSGVYTAAQATTGQGLYESTCLGGCHGRSDHTGIAFRQRWAGHSLFELFQLIHDRMPDDDPGTLSSDESLQLVAYLLKLNGLPAGSDALGSDATALKKIKIELPPSIPNQHRYTRRPS